MPSFTETLLDRYADDFKLATQHPFLRQAGLGSLDKEVLTRWCRQDYLYAFVGYIKYASLLLSKLPLPSSPPSSTASSRSKALYAAIPLLSFSISNVKRETDFFVQTAIEHGLDLLPDGPDGAVGAEGSKTGAGGRMPIIDPSNGLGEYEEVTRHYVDFLWGTGAGGSVEEGLVLLWAMEKAYYEAWSYAKRHLTPVTDNQTQTQTQVALGKFIDNWTCDEFVGFVGDCKHVVDGLELEKDPEMAERCEQIFKRVLYLEQRFWPSVKE